MSGQVNPSYQGDGFKKKTAYDNASYVIDKDDIEVKVQSEKIPDTHDDGIDRRCGYGKLKTRWMQVFNKMSVFVFWVVIYCFLEGFAINGLASAAIPSIERQFQLTSTKSALIPSSQDIGALIVVLFVSFIGGRHHKPFIVASGAVIMAFGSFLFLVPHIAEEYIPGALSKSSDDICPAGGGGGGGSPPSCESSGEKYLAVFMAAQILHGLGFTPMFTLGTVYIDENAEHSMAALYIGLTYAAAAVGVAAGFFAGGQMSEKLFVDFDRVDQESLGFNARDQRWIGAWWLGFIISTVGFLLVAIPIYGYPKYMPGYGPNKETDESKGKDDKKGVGHSVKEIIKSFFKELVRLIKNPVYMFINLGGCTSSIIISGVSAFSFKFLAEQYRVNLDVAGYLIGGLILVGAVGMVMGGVLVKIFRLDVIGMTRLSALVALMSATLGLSFLAGCPNVNLVGLSTPYSENSAISGYIDTCQGSCDCTSSTYTPVCGHGNNVYYSPCHAGCTTQTSVGQETKYGNCSCIASRLNVSVTDERAVAMLGRCEDNCTNLKILAPCLYFALLAMLLSVTPTSMATLRCVDEDQRSFAIGLQWLLMRLLGLIPGPLLVGAVLDSTCEIWTEIPCTDSKFCMMYDLSRMSSGIMLWWVVVGVLASLFYFTASIFASRNKNKFTLDSK